MILAKYTTPALPNWLSECEIEIIAFVLLFLFLLMRSCLHVCYCELPDLYSGLSQGSIGDRGRHFTEVILKEIFWSERCLITMISDTWYSWGLVDNDDANKFVANQMNTIDKPPKQTWHVRKEAYSMQGNPLRALLSRWQGLFKRVLRAPYYQLQLSWFSM